MHENVIERPTAITLAGVVNHWAATTPEAPAILYRGESISYAELSARVDEFARGLLALDVKRGDRVAILFGNDPDWVVAALACAAAGAVCVPLNTWYKSSELNWTLRHAAVSVLICADRILKTDYRIMIGELLPHFATGEAASRSGSDFPSLKTLVFKGEGMRGAISIADLVEGGRRQPAGLLAERGGQIENSDTAFVLYTSGSTSEPKGVMLNHHGVIQNGFDMGAARAIEPSDKVWLGSPLFYGLGATNALPATLTRGAALVLQDHFEAGLAIETIEATRATVFYGTGNMSRAIIDHPSWTSERTSSLAKGNAGTMSEYKRLTLVEMGIKGAVPAYGLTESYGNVTVGHPDDPIDVKLATSGKLLPGMEMRIVDPDSRADLPRGKTGLVLIRGHVTPGYLDNPAETAKALLADGWFDTGDLGHLNEDGYFVFHSRLKEVLKTGGINVSPVEIEQLLAGHPLVRDAYVVGVADPVKGDLIVAFVDAAGTVTEQELKAFVKDQAASFKVPHHIFQREESQLPRLASGKVAKFKLAEEARSELGLLLQ